MSEPPRTNIRTAFVLGAGLGTRLKTLTRDRPKPLIPILHKPLITRAFDHLLDAGIDRLIVNTHHQAERYREFFPEPTYRGATLHFRHEPELLETAGGIKNVADLIGNEPFVVYNGDVMSDLPLQPALKHHAAQKNEVTLVLRSQPAPRQVACRDGRVYEIGGSLTAPMDERYLFTGIYIVEPEFLVRIPAATKISVIPIFREMLAQKARLGGLVADEGTWRDLGTREEYLAVHRLLLPGAHESSIHPSAQIDPTAQVQRSVIGADAVVGPQAQLRDCVLWEGAEIAAKARLEHCVVTAGKKVDGQHADTDF